MLMWMIPICHAIKYCHWVTLSQASEEIAEYKVTLWVCRRRVVSWTEPTKKTFFLKMSDLRYSVDQNTPTLPFLSVIHQSALNDTRHCGYGHGEKSSHRSRVRTSPDNSSWHGLRSSTFSVRIRSDITQTYFTACYSHKLRPTFRN